MHCILNKHNANSLYTDFFSKQRTFGKFELNENCVCDPCFYILFFVVLFIFEIMSA